MKWRWLILLILPVIAGADPEVAKLQDSILQKTELKQHGETAQLLQQLKQLDSQRYHALPYAMLHAKALQKSGQSKAALEIYQSLIGDRNYSAFALLSSARISAELQDLQKASGYYRDYLKNPSNRDYLSVAQEALNFSLSHNRMDDVSLLVPILHKNSSAKRLAQYCLAKSYQMRNQKDQARSIFLTLLSGTKKDDVTGRALLELDLLDDKSIPESELVRRGKLAFDIWNFDLSRKYLEPVSSKNVEASYYFGRTLFLTGDFPGARKMFQQTMQSWPQDPLAERSHYQFANVYLREGDYAKAAEAYKDVYRKSTGKIREESGTKAVYALRAQSRFSDALQVLQPYVVSKNSATKGEALFLRGRIYFQLGKYNEALASFQQVLLLPKFKKSKEVLLWKAIALEKLKRKNESLSIYRTLAMSNDFYSHVAAQRIPGMPAKSKVAGNVSLCRLPGRQQEPEVVKRLEANDPLSAFLYLHLYEEAAHLLPGVTTETWKILGIDPKNRSQKYLALVQLAGLGENYATATYYGELFLKSQPASFSVFSLPDQLLRVLFPWPYKEEILKSAKLSEVDPFLVLAIMRQESKFKRFARSQQFARGLMQLIPSTAARMAGALGYQDFTTEKLYHPETNINLGTRYVRVITDEFGSHVEYVAAGYNGGESNLRRWLASSYREEPVDFVSTIDLSETKNYVMTVRTNYELYKRIYSKDVVLADSRLARTAE